MNDVLAANVVWQTPLELARQIVSVAGMFGSVPPMACSVTLAVTVCVAPMLIAATEAADFTSSRAVQLHGGIGFTWESDVHFFFKRNKHSELLFGDAAYHKARVADLLIDG